MKASTEASLTGSTHGAPATHAASVSIALGRLRFGVLACCWIVGLALLAQTVVWGLTAFTELRFETAPAAADGSALIVTSGDESEFPSALDAVAKTPAGVEPVDPNRMISRYDRVFDVASRLARGLGTLGVLALLPLIAVSVLLAASSATNGVEKVVSAFTWAVVVALLALPLGGLLGLSHADGALWTYGELTAEVDARETALIGDDGIDKSQLAAIARYLCLPLAVLCAVGMVGLRFEAGVQAGLMRKEDLTLDPTLEQEAGNVKAGSLHGSRAAAAMRPALDGPIPLGSTKEKPVLPSNSPSIKQVSAGEVPKRLI